MVWRGPRGAENEIAGLVHKDTILSERLVQARICPLARRAESNWHHAKGCVDCLTAVQDGVNPREFHWSYAVDFGVSESRFPPRFAPRGFRRQNLPSKLFAGIGHATGCCCLWSRILLSN